MTTTANEAGSVCTADCPECEWKFQIERPERNEVVRCADCNLSFVVKDVDEATRLVELELTDADADDWGQ